MPERSLQGLMWGLAAVAGTGTAGRIGGTCWGLIWGSGWFIAPGVHQIQGVTAACQYPMHPLTRPARDTDRPLRTATGWRRAGY